MAHNPSFSFGRLGLLLKMEWFANRRPVLFFSLLFTAAVFAVQTFFVFLSGRLTSFFPNPLVTYSVFSIALSLYAFLLINRRMNRSDTVAHTILPATAWEKFIIFLLIYFFFTLLIWACNQLCYTMSYTLSATVTVREVAPAYLWYNPYFASGIINDFLPSTPLELDAQNMIAMSIATSLYTLGSFLLPAVYMRKNIHALLMAMAMQIVMIMVVSFTAVSIKETEWLQNTTNTVAGFIWTISIPFGVVGLIYLLLSYRIIKNKQLRS